MVRLVLSFLIASEADSLHLPIWQRIIGKVLNARIAPQRFALQGALLYDGILNSVRRDTMGIICASVQRTSHACTDMGVYMPQHRSILIGVILSLLASVNIDASTPAQLDLAAFRAAALKQHNVYRAKHGVPPLVLSAQLNDVAQHNAEQLARTNQLVHSDNTQLGENLYAFGSSGQALPRSEAVVDRWYGEIQNYNFNKPSFHTGTGHFTQLVWKSSKELGMGMAQAADGTWYVVANYSPPGNISGQFPLNVLKPKK